MEVILPQPLLASVMTPGLPLIYLGHDATLSLTLRQRYALSLPVSACRFLWCASPWRRRFGFLSTDFASLYGSRIDLLLS